MVSNFWFEGRQVKIRSLRSVLGSRRFIVDLLDTLHTPTPFTMLTEEGVRGPFRPTKTIVLSELSTRERELYYSLLVANNAKFYRDEDGRYIGNVRILAPHEKKVENELRRRNEASNYSISFQERLTKLKNEGFIDVTVVAPEHLEYNAYPRFTALIANNGDTVRPRQRPFTWVMKIVEDIFDHRFSLEKNDIEREDESPSFDLMLLIFPVFVVRKIGTNVGLKTIVDQTCWDLLYNVNLYRKDYLELEVRASFFDQGRFYVFLTRSDFHYEYTRCLGAFCKSFMTTMIFCSFCTCARCWRKCSTFRSRHAGRRSSTA